MSLWCTANTPSHSPCSPSQTRLSSTSAPSRSGSERWRSSKFYTCPTSAVSSSCSSYSVRFTCPPGWSYSSRWTGSLSCDYLFITLPHTCTSGQGMFFWRWTGSLSSDIITYLSLCHTPVLPVRECFFDAGQVPCHLVSVSWLSVHAYSSRQVCSRFTLPCCH